MPNGKHSIKYGRAQLKAMRQQCRSLRDRANEALERADEKVKTGPPKDSNLHRLCAQFARLIEEATGQPISVPHVGSEKKTVLRKMGSLIKPVRKGAEQRALAA